MVTDVQFSEVYVLFDGKVFVWQLNHAEGKGNIFTSPSDEYWRLVRKGIMPAFSSNNIR